MKQSVYDDVFEYIVRYKRASCGVPPSRRDIAEGCNLSSLSVCKYILDKLRDRGKIYYAPMAHSRNICVVGEKYTINLHVEK